MNFVAIDFETANSSRSSACSVGLAYVEDGEIIGDDYFLIRPEPLLFNEFNTFIHGITEKDVEKAPDFLTLWDSISPNFKGLPLVAHNAAFDMSVIRACMDAHEREYPRIDYMCTYRLAQTVESNLGCYRLDYLCRKHGIELAHHDAASDAVACAKLFLELCNLSGVSDISGLKSRNLINFGSIYPGGYYPCTARNYVISQKTKINQVDLEGVCPSDEFMGKHFVFTGDLLSIPRGVARELVAKLGGVIQERVNRETNYLVSGMQNPVALRGRSISTKMEKALKMAESGQGIQIIQEDDFLKMLDSDIAEKFLHTV